MIRGEGQHPGWRQDKRNMMMGGVLSKDMVRGMGI